MSKNSRKQWHKNQSRRASNSRAALSNSSKQNIAMNAQMLNYDTGQGGIQDRGRGQIPATDGLINPFIYGTDIVRMSQWAWVLYAGDWAAKKIVDLPVFDTYREGWTLKYSGDKPDGSGIEKAITEAEDKLEVAKRFAQAERLERMLGGAAIIIGVRSDDDDSSKPLTPYMVDKGDLQYLNVIGRNFISKVEWNMDVNSKDYGRPKHYNIRGRVFHASRLIIFDGDPVTPYPGHDFISPISNSDGMGMSVFSPTWDALMRVNSYQQGAAHLAQSANVWIAAKTGLKNLQAARAGKTAISELQQMVEDISMYRAAIIDGEDVKIQQLSANFGAIPELIMTGYQILSAASDIPATRFLAQAPGGLSTDDRSGLENYYNNIGARQRLTVDPRLRQLEPFLLNHIFGRGVIKTSEIAREFEPLWNASETERAAVRTADIANITALETANIFTRENAIEELIKREAIEVKPNIEELEAQADEMLGMAAMAGIDPAGAVKSVGGDAKLNQGLSRKTSLGLNV